MWAILTVLVVHLACMLHLDAPFLVCVASSVIPGMIYAYCQKKYASYNAICSEMDELKALHYKEIEFKVGEVQGVVHQNNHLKRDVEALERRLVLAHAQTAEIQKELKFRMLEISDLHTELRRYQQQSFHWFSQQAVAQPVTLFSTRQGVDSSRPGGQ